MGANERMRNNLCHVLLFTTVTTLLLLQSHPALAETGDQNEAAEAIAKTPASESNSHKELTKSDLVEALEKLSSSHLWIERSSGDRSSSDGKRTSESMFDGESVVRTGASRSAEKGESYSRSSADYSSLTDSELLTKLSSIEDKIESLRRKQAVEALPPRPEGQRAATDSRLSALLSKLNSGKPVPLPPKGAGAEREDERRFFSNAGPRGKKEELEGGSSNDDVYEVMLEMAGVVRDLTVKYLSQKEETERAIDDITQIMVKLASYHIDPERQVKK